MASHPPGPFPHILSSFKSIASVALQHGKPRGWKTKLLGVFSNWPSLRTTTVKTGARPARFKGRKIDSHSLYIQTKEEMMAAIFSHKLPCDLFSQLSQDLKHSLCKSWTWVWAWLSQAACVPFNPSLQDHFMSTMVPGPLSTSSTPELVGSLHALGATGCWKRPSPANWAVPPLLLC